jgi:hypothetical protein
MYEATKVDYCAVVHAVHYENLDLAAAKILYGNRGVADMEYTLKAIPLRTPSRRARHKCAIVQ